MTDAPSPEALGGGTADGGDPDHVLDDLNDRIADARLGPEAILNAVTSALSRIRRGTWVAYLIGKDPRTVKVVAANEKNPQMARYLEDMHRSGEASGLLPSCLTWRSPGGRGHRGSRRAPASSKNDAPLGRFR